MTADPTQSSTILTDAMLTLRDRSDVLDQQLTDLRPAMTESLGLSRPCRSVRRLHQAYVEARSALDYRLFAGENSVIGFWDVCDSIRGRYHPPTEELEGLARAIEGNGTEQIRRAFDRIMELADHFGLSVSNVSRKYKHHSGKTLSDSMTSIRMEREVSHRSN